MKHFISVARAFRDLHIVDINRTGCKKRRPIKRQEYISSNPYMMLSIGIEIVFEKMMIFSGGMALAIRIPIMLETTSLLVCKASGTASMMALQPLDAISSRSEAM